MYDSNQEGSSNMIHLETSRAGGGGGDGGVTGW